MLKSARALSAPRPPGRNRVNVKIEKSILKYFIIIVTTKLVGAGIDLEIGSAAVKRTILHWEKPSIRFKMAATVGTQYLSTEKTRPTHNAITVNGCPIPFI